MNKELREDLEHLIICNDKTITQDLRDDVSLTLQYIDELENKIDKAIEYIERNCLEFNVKYACQGLNNDKVDVLLDILRGKDNE